MRVEVKVREGDEGPEHAEATRVRDDLAPASRVRSPRRRQRNDGAREHLDRERQRSDRLAARPALGGDGEGRDDDAEAGGGGGLPEAGERHVRPSVPPPRAHPARRRRLIVPAIVTLRRRVSAWMGRGSSRGRRTGHVRELHARRAAPAAVRVVAPRYRARRHRRSRPPRDGERVTPNTCDSVSGGDSTHVGDTR